MAAAVCSSGRVPPQPHSCTGPIVVRSCGIACGWWCRYFVLEFKLVDSKELSPLQELIDSMMGQDKQKLMGASGSSAAASSPAAASAPVASPTAAEDDACVVKNN